MSLLAEFEHSHWAVDGARTVFVSLLAWRRAGCTELCGDDHVWVRNSSVAEMSAVYRKHKLLLEILRVLIKYDLFGPAGLAGLEQLARRIYQLGIGVDQNYKLPGFDGPYAFADTSTRASRAANVPTKAMRLSKHQSPEAFVPIQTRLWSKHRKKQSKE